MEKKNSEYQITVGDFKTVADLEEGYLWLWQMFTRRMQAEGKFFRELQAKLEPVTDANRIKQLPAQEKGKAIERAVISKFVINRINKFREEVNRVRRNSTKRRDFSGFDRTGEPASGNTSRT